MNLLLLDQFSDLGGAQQALLELLPAIRERGWSATIGIPGDGPLFERIRALGFPTARLACGPYRSGAKSWSDLCRFALDTPMLAGQIRRLAAEADLIHVNGPRLLPGVALARAQAPVLFQAHSLLPPGRTRALAGLALRESRARVVAACEYVAASWREFVAADRVHVVYNGVAGPRCATWRGGGAKIGCIGRIAPEKGQAEFVQAAHRIGAALPHARFMVYGAALFGDARVARYAERVRMQATGLPLEFAGWAPDVYGALSQLDLLLVPSASHEATTRVILEAYAAGVPVIAFRAGGIPEVIEHGRTGWLVESPDQMAALAIELLRAPEALPSVSRAAREEWERRFTQQHYQEQLLRYMQSSGVHAAPPAYAR